MPRQALASSAFGWMELNAMSELVRRALGGRALLLRYEDLTADARRSLRRILELIGEPRTALPIDEAGRAHVRENHTVSGNPGRFASGPRAVRADVEWVSSMPRARSAATTLLTWPLLLRYGYPMRRPELR
jgi:hypothetical protein